MLLYVDKEGQSSCSLFCSIFVRSLSNLSCCSYVC